MAIHFLDSSALVKRYITEIGSAWISDLFNPALGNEVFVAAIAGVEIVAAITRRSRGGSLSTKSAQEVCKQLRVDLEAEYQIIEITDSIIDLGMQLAENHGLRGYDAIQLAAACAINKICIANNLPSIIFVSADKELNNAASNEGLIVENPNDYS